MLIVVWKNSIYYFMITNTLIHIMNSNGSDLESSYQMIKRVGINTFLNLRSREILQSTTKSFWKNNMSGISHKIVKCISLHDQKWLYFKGIVSWNEHLYDYKWSKCKLYCWYSWNGFKPYIFMPYSKMELNTRYILTKY